MLLASKFSLTIRFFRKSVHLEPSILKTKKQKILNTNVRELARGFLCGTPVDHIYLENLLVTLEAFLNKQYLKSNVLCVIRLNYLFPKASIFFFSYCTVDKD